MATRERNGGLIQMDELMRKVEQLRGRNAQDVSESIKTLSPLGSGFAIHQIGSKKMVQSVPRELNTDQSSILTLAQVNWRASMTSKPANVGDIILRCRITLADGHVTVCDVERQLGWIPARAQTALVGLAFSNPCYLEAAQTFSSGSDAAAIRPTHSQTAVAWRSNQAGLLNEGICWVDEQAECGSALYWVPSLFKAFVNG
ncbi:MAG: hypothetical protein BJ554DRAFT_6381 [Olpidium bornovanus]|uniref:Uncharacterized protein n=1 Tax=Olpidium bornovanus TaxID=278681 RepID=A0A8H7ZXZ1_9FUNG|nr:MAG: hypothetical protein BJ554DRAFT_6381 [Olpidium bornovanus]